MALATAEMRDVDDGERIRGFHLDYRAGNKLTQMAPRAHDGQRTFQPPQIKRIGGRRHRTYQTFQKGFFLPVSAGAACISAGLAVGTGASAAACASVAGACASICA